MNIEDLANWGANVEEGLGRCMGMEDFYLRLVATVRDDAGFDALEEAVAEGRLNDAFEAAHALKGSLGNLSLTPLYEPVYEITELLRNETQTDYAPLLSKIADEKAKLSAL